MGFFSLAGTGPTTRVTRAMGLVISSCTVTCHLNSTPSSSSSNMFGDLKTAAGVKALDAFLADNSYIEGYVPSQADTAVFEALKGAPGSDTPHAQRWYNHIKSFAAGMKQFAKASKDASAYVAAGGAAPAPAVAERLKAYAERKAKKPGPIAKTNVLLDVKPWDDETNMDDMLKSIKTIEKDGLVWGANKLVPVGYGINKLQVMCVVEDEKVSIDELCEQICEFEDFVQSCDVSAMSKIQLERLVA